MTSPSHTMEEPRPDQRPAAAAAEPVVASARRSWTPLAVAGGTALLSVVPALFDRAFYLRGDTAAQFAPTWFHLGEMVRGGQWPPWLDPGAWVGGNYAAESLFGIYNPVNLAVWVLVSLLPNLLVSVFLVKAATMVMLSLGVLVLARDYGADDAAAALVAVALPFTGYTLYWDAGSWASGLAAFAYTPWVWWAFRRVVRGRLNVFWAFVIGSLAVTQGNPYGTLAVVVIGLSLVLEGLVARDRIGVRRVLLLGVCVAMWLPLVYLPLLQTAPLGARSVGALFANNAMMRPQLGDLLALGAPTYLPGIRSITGPTLAPVTYGAWFVLPLLPWLQWGTMRRRVGPASLAGVGAVSLAYVVLAIGPSNLWLFRWPLRLVEYAYLGLAVAFAVALSQGLARDHRAQRSLGSAGAVLLMIWMTWSQDPGRSLAVALGGGLLGVLVAVLVTFLVLRRGPETGAPPRRTRAGRLVAALEGGGGTSVIAAVGLLGAALVLVAQCLVFGENAGSRVWHFPNDVSTLRDRFSDRQGTVLQFADVRSLQRPGHDAQLRDAWQDYLAGSMYHVAGVRSVNNYTGIGYAAFTRRLCMHYDGLTKRCGYPRAWRPERPGGPALIDLMKVVTLVVQPAQAPGVVAPAGWQRVSGPTSGPTSGRPQAPLVLRRTRAPVFAGSRLSDAQGVQVAVAHSDGPYTERVRVTGNSTGRGVLTFAMLAWPGYSARLGTETVPVQANSAGLLTVRLPQGARGELEVSYRPPALDLGLAAAGLGTLGAVALGLAGLRRDRRRRSEPRIGPMGG